jgi:hypothetical protein
MGEAKRKKERLGPWYGRPVAPGHPDFVEPPRRERPTYERRTVAVATSEPMERADGASEPNEKPPPETGKGEVPEKPTNRLARPNRPPARRVSGLGLALIASTLCAGIDLGPPPEPPNRRRP